MKRSFLLNFVYLGFLCFTCCLLAASNSQGQNQQNLPDFSIIQFKEYPNVYVNGCHPFTQETNYMSAAGYLRWQKYRHSREWIFYYEAELVVCAMGFNQFTRWKWLKPEDLGRAQKLGAEKYDREKETRAKLKK